MINIRNSCRICGCPLEDIFDLGKFYLPCYINDDFLPIKRKVPLVLARCDTSHEGACGLIQLRHSVSSSLLYKNYFYRSAVNEHMVNHIKKIADKSLNLVKVQEDDIIVDIGCNDGTLLKYYKDKGYKNVFGFDPARNMLQFSKESGAIVYEDYFSADHLLFNKKKAKVITSIAMFYDLENPNIFVSDVKKVLKEDGIWVTEQSYLPSMLLRNSFDTICHEHLEYYCFFVFEKLIEKHGLEVIDVFLNDTNGGSFQAYVAHKGIFSPNNEAFKRISNIRIEEFNLQLDTPIPYKSFINRVEKNKREILNLLDKIKSKKQKIFAYGASTKGSIILQYLGLDNNIISKCADRNPMKWGLKMMGTNIPIISEEEARIENPDYFFVLPWHFMTGFMQREKDFLDRGGKFIVPMPSVKIIGKEDMI